MRRAMTTLTLVSVCLMILIVGASGATRAGHPKAHTGARTLTVVLSPALDDLSLAQISFPAAHGRHLSTSMLRIAKRAFFVDDYMAMAAITPTDTPGLLRALVLLVNRPTPLADPIHLRVRIVASRSLGTPQVRAVDNPLKGRQCAAGTCPRVPMKLPSLCIPDLKLATLEASMLSVLAVRGSQVPGFSAANAIAQAYDFACGLPFDGAFISTVESGGEAAPQPQPAPPAPEPPVPPVGKVPGEGCTPTPGYACPG